MEEFVGAAAVVIALEGRRGWASESYCPRTIGGVTAPVHTAGGGLLHPEHLSAARSLLLP